MTQIADSKTSNSKGLGVFGSDSDVYFYYRVVKENGVDLQVLSSSDGLSVQTFHKSASLKTRDGQELPLSGVEAFRISQLGSVYALTYKDRSKNTPDLMLALSKDMVSWTAVSTLKGIHETALIVPNHYENQNFLMFYGDQDIRIATSQDILTWSSKSEPILKAMKDQWGTLSLIVGAVVPMEAGIALLYYARGVGGSHWSIHGVMLDKKNPQNILWEADTIWELHQGWEGKRVNPMGMIFKNGKLYSYWDFEREGIFAIEHAAFNGIINKKAEFNNMTLKRFDENPVIKPTPENFWESKATFNAAAMYEQGKVHLIYRAIGDFDTSVLGYAASNDGTHFNDRSPDPIYVPTQSFEMPVTGTPWNGASAKTIVNSPYESGGGGYGGCEDPRITKIDDKYYMTYVAYDGANPPRVALTSINVNDFHNKNWDWQPPVLISPPGVVDKNCVIFPEKINGKFAVMHRIYPNILLDYVDDLNFDGNTFLKGELRIKPSRTLWDSRKVGAGPPPLKTKYGWLLIYHAVGEKDSGRYKIGAMLLDLKDPTKVIAKTIIPILAPDHRHENEGFKAGVAYPCGAVIKDDTLFVYYGGADTVVCGAYAHIDRFLEELLATGGMEIKPVYLPAFAEDYAEA